MSSKSALLDEEFRQNPLQTRERILNVAEDLFAERGVGNVSVRDIVRAAAVNLGAINYHFESREKLIVEVFARGLAPLNRARLEALDKVERAAGSKKLKVAEVLEAFIRPTIEQALHEKGRAANRFTLLGRCHVEPEPALQEYLGRELDPIVKRFDAALRRAAPELSFEEIFWRMGFIIGGINHTLTTIGKPIPAWLKIKPDSKGQIERLIEFATAGMSAPIKARKS